MKAELVYTHETGKFRVYKLSEPITKGYCDVLGSIDINEIIKNELDSQIEETVFTNALIERLNKGVEYVTISDSRVHLERLTFPAFKLNLPDEPYGCIYDNICGKHTWLIKGGDPKSIHPDEVYLRRLTQINNLKWEKLLKN